MGQIYSRAVIDSILNLDRLWTYSLKHRTQLTAVILDDNNNVLTFTIVCRYI